MTRRCALLAAPLVCLAALSATLVQAADDVLSVVPQGALGFAVINRLAETDATIQAVGRRMQLPVPSLLGQLKESIGIEKGLDEKGSALIVVMPGEDGDDEPAAWRYEPVVLLYVPVTDYGQFIGQLEPEDADDELAEVQVMGGEFLVGKDGGYAVFAEPRHEDTLKKAIDSPNRVSEELAPLKAWLAENSAGVVVTRAGIELISDMVIKGLQQTRAFFASMPAEASNQMQAAIAVFEIYEEFFKAAEANIQTYAAAVRVDDSGAILETERLRFTSGGTLAKAMAAVGPPQGDLLAGLPSGPFVFAAAGVLPEGIMDGMMDFSIRMQKAMPQMYGDLTDEQMGKLTEISRKSMKGIRGMSLLWGVGKGKKSTLLGGMLVVMKVDDSKAYLDSDRKFLEEMNELVKDVENSMFKGMQIKEIQIDGVKALQMSMSLPKMPATANVPGYDEMMEKFFGPGGKLTAFIVPVDEHTVLMGYSKRMVRAGLEAAKSPETGLSANAGVAKTAAMLMPGAQWVGYLSPKGTIDFINRIVLMAPPGVDLLTLPEFPATPPIGFAAKTAPGELRFQTVVPAPVIKAIGQYVVEIQKMIESEKVGEEEAFEVPLF